MHFRSAGYAFSWFGSGCRGMVTMSLADAREGGAGVVADSLFELAPEPQLLIDPFADRVLAANAAARRFFNTQTVVERV